MGVEGLVVGKIHCSEWWAVCEIHNILLAIKVFKLWLTNFPIKQLHYILQDDNMYVGICKNMEDKGEC